MPTHHHDYPTVHLPQVPVRRLLDGQTAIVTGASSGIGKSIAFALGAAGANVCVNYVTGPEKAKAVVEEIEKDGSDAFAQQADVSSEADVLAMFEAVRTEFGSVDILVNNAGLQVDAPFTEMTRVQWQKVIDVNLTGQFLCAREAVREFRRHGVRPEISCAGSLERAFREGQSKLRSPILERICRWPLRCR
jgi:glucose 1-dehydrogenase